MARDGACGQQEANALHGTIHLHITKKTRYLLRRLLERKQDAQRLVGIDFGETSEQLMESRIIQTHFSPIETSCKCMKHGDQKSTIIKGVEGDEQFPEHFGRNFSGNTLAQNVSRSTKLRHTERAQKVGQHGATSFAQHGIESAVKNAAKSDFPYHQSVQKPASATRLMLTKRPRNPLNNAKIKDLQQTGKQTQGKGLA